MLEKVKCYEQRVDLVAFSKQRFQRWVIIRILGKNHGRFVSVCMSYFHYGKVTRANCCGGNIPRATNAAKPRPVVEVVVCTC